MNIMVVDDEELAVESLVKVLHKEQPEAEIVTFLKPVEAFEYLTENPVDIAFLDIEMGVLSGLALAKKCKDLCPSVNIIFVTGYSQYALEALELHASGYLMKPVRADKLRKELDNLRHPLPPSNKRVRIQTFGNFEVFVDGKPLPLTLAKTKECLAYLVDRKGARVTTAELAGVLWEDELYDRRVQNNTYNLIAALMNALRRAGIADLVLKTRRDIAINTEAVDCDYYRFLSGDTSQINAFHGEYMSNYSWAEFTLGELVKIRKKV